MTYNAEHRCIQFSYEISPAQQQAFIWNIPMSVFTDEHGVEVIFIRIIILLTLLQRENNVDKNMEVYREY